MTTDEPKKSTTKATREPKVGDRVYWDGDCANPSHVFEVKALEDSRVRLLDVCEPSLFGAEFDCGSRAREIVIPASLLYSHAWGWNDEKEARRAWLLEEARERLSRKAS